MIVIEFKFSDLNSRLAERSAIYASPVIVDEENCTSRPIMPDYLNMPNEVLKSLTIIGLGKITSKLKGWIKDYQSDDVGLQLTLDINADDKYFVESLIQQSIDAYIMAETLLTSSEVVSNHFRAYFNDAVESLVCYLSYLQQKRSLNSDLIQSII